MLSPAFPELAIWTFHSLKLSKQTAMTWARFGSSSINKIDLLIFIIFFGGEL